MSEMEAKREKISKQFQTTNQSLRAYINEIVRQPGLGDLAGILGAEFTDSGKEKEKEKEADPGKGEEEHAESIGCNVQGDLDHSLRAVAEHLIVASAKDTLKDAPAKWTAKQIERVRKPLLAFHLIKEDELKEGKSLRNAILRIKTDEGKNQDAERRSSIYFAADCKDHLIYCVRTFLIAAINKGVGVDPKRDPRSNLVCLTTASRACYFHESALRRDETDHEECSITWRSLEPQDPVKRFRVEFDLDSEREKSPESPGFVYTGVMDHALLKDRLAGINDALAEILEMRVSDLGINIVNYSMSTSWLSQKFRSKIIVPGIEYASGVVSSEVLSQQRAKKQSGKQNPPVLKKNKPAKTEQCFKAFERCTWYDDAIDYILEIYYQLKKLQIDYIVACHIIGLIYHHHHHHHQPNRDRSGDRKTE